MALSIGLVLVLLVAGIWVVPGMLDWNRYRGSIAGLVAAGIGRPVRIGGNVTLHLLPQPILTASGIEVDDTGGGAVLSARELRLRVALGPLLAGRVDARELTLRHADLRLPWPPPAGALAQRPPAWLTGLQARVEESRLQVGNLVLDNIAAALVTNPDSGTLSTAGTATLFGRNWQFTARLARPGRDGAAALDVSLDGRDRLRDTGGTFSGVLEADGALAGRVAARGSDLSQLMPGPAIAWRGDGRLSAASGLAVADELALEIGGAPATGAVALRVQPQLRLDVALSTGRLDLDAWLPVLLRAAQPGTPPSFPTGLDLSAESATLAGGTLRRLRGAFDLEADGVTVRDASALLPGDAALTVAGRLPGPARGTLFDGTARLSAPDLRATLRWLEPLLPAVLRALPPETLRATTLSGKVTLAPQLAALSDLHGTLDGGALQGGVSLHTGPRIGISAGLALDSMTLDPWLPDLNGLASPVAAYGRLTQALAHAGFDADVKLQVGQADWGGVALGALSVDAQSEAGRLTLRRLEATPLGFRVTASGTVGEGGRITEGRLDVSTQEVAPLRKLLPWSAPRLLQGPGSLLVQLSGLPEALAARGTMELGDLRVELQPVVNLAARKWAGAVTLQHPGAPRLLELAGLPDTADWLGSGSLSLIAQFAAEPDRLQLDNVELVAGALRAGGQLSFAQGALTGHIAAETLPLPLPGEGRGAAALAAALQGMRAAVRIDAAEVRLGLSPVLQGFAADLSLQDDVLRLGRVAARLQGGTLGGSASLTLGGLPQLAVQAQAVNVTLTGPLWGGTLDLLSGQLGATLDLHGEGYSPEAMLATLSGTGTVRVTDGTLAGFDLAAAAAALAGADRPAIPRAVAAALGAGETPFQRLESPLTIRNGVVSLNAEAVAPAGTARLTGTLDLSSLGLDGRLAVHPAGELPELLSRIAGPAMRPVRTPELAGLARWLAERS